MNVTPCRTVLYRNRDGVDMPAIVTGLDPNGDPFLTCFPPPGADTDHMDHQWGIPEDPDPASPSPKHWRWPPREQP